MRKKLTDRYLDSLQPPATGRLEIGDADVPGLVLCMAASGIKSWTIRYRPTGTEQQRASYGTYPAIRLGEARQRAREITAAAVTGIDLPAQEKREREAERQAAGRPQTLGDQPDEYVERGCKPNQQACDISGT